MAWKILMALATHHDEKTGLCAPSSGQVVKQLKTSHKTFYKYREELLQLGLIDIYSRRNMVHDGPETRGYVLGPRTPALTKPVGPPTGADWYGPR